jgi:hypothetical protein
VGASRIHALFPLTHSSQIISYNIVSIFSMCCRLILDDWSLQTRSHSRERRLDPKTGIHITPPVIADSDFRNTYCIMGICAVDPFSSPFQFTIGEENHRSECFVELLEALVAACWHKRDDIAVVDNSQVHSGGAAKDLEDFLWNCPSPIDGQPLHILILFLLTHSPELNPIELVECLKCLYACMVHSTDEMCLFSMLET